MKTDCEVIRDLLPLYADDACSEKSREMVNEHLLDCAECRTMLEKLKETEIEADLRTEKKEVIEYGAKRMKRRSAQVGSVISGIFMIPILVCLWINIASGSAMGWFFIVLAAMAVAASLIVVPLMVPQDKAFWMFCAFTASLMVLLGVTCLVTGGRWFFIAYSASLFGLSAVFLPFLIRARPAQQLIGKANKLLVVLGVDAALFVNMMNMIFSHGRITLKSIVFTIGVVAGIGFVATEIMRKRGNDNE